MAYILQHYFSPDFDHLNLKPKELGDGRVDHYNLNYVQNVVTGQVLAEIKDISDEEASKADSRYIQETPELPAGDNAKVNPNNPRQLLATANGYVYYFEGKICVKNLLNVRRDVDFHTGNIFFLGDVAVHGGVRSGFELQARNIVVNGTIEGAFLDAQESITSQSGLKGGRIAILKAGQSIRLPFAEQAQLMCRGAIRIDGSCMHCDVYAHDGLRVGGRLLGGTIASAGTIVVGQQLGGGANTSTKILLGYDPYLINRVEEIEHAIDEHRERMAELEEILSRTPTLREEYEEKLIKLKKKVALFHRQLVKANEKLEQELNPEVSRLLVPGEIKAGVTIQMGQQRLKIYDDYQNVRFIYRDDEIRMETPALTRE